MASRYLRKNASLKRRSVAQKRNVTRPATRVSRTAAQLSLHSKTLLAVLLPGEEVVNDTDGQHRQWMRMQLDTAAEHFSLTLDGEPKFGWLTARSQAGLPAPTAIAGCECRGHKSTGQATVSGQGIRTRQ